MLTVTRYLSIVLQGWCLAEALGTVRPNQIFCASRSRSEGNPSLVHATRRGSLGTPGKFDGVAEELGYPNQMMLLACHPRMVQMECEVSTTYFLLLHLRPFRETLPNFICGDKKLDPVATIRQQSGNNQATSYRMCVISKNRTTCVPSLLDLKEGTSKHYNPYTAPSRPPPSSAISQTTTAALLPIDRA